MNLSEKLKAESEEVMTPDDFLGNYQEQVWDKELNETYPDVFLKDTSGINLYIMHIINFNILL